MRYHGNARIFPKHHLVVIVVLVVRKFNALNWDISRLRNVNAENLDRSVVSYARSLFRRATPSIIICDHFFNCFFILIEGQFAKKEKRIQIHFFPRILLQSIPHFELENNRMQEKSDVRLRALKKVVLVWFNKKAS